MASPLFSLSSLTSATVLGLALLTSGIPSWAQSAETMPDRQQFQAVNTEATGPIGFWQLPNLASITSPNQLIQQFYSRPLTPGQLGEGDFGCFRSQQASLEAMDNDRVAVLLTQMGACDDSVSGQQTRIDLVANGDRWQVDWAGQRYHCRGQFWGEPGQLCP